MLGFLRIQFLRNYTHCKVAGSSAVCVKTLSIYVQKSEFMCKLGNLCAGPNLRKSPQTSDPQSLVVHLGPSPRP